MTETIIQLPNGWTLRSEAGDNVRLCLPNGSERIYWDSNEWHEDPVGVMGAIFGAATRCPLDKSYSAEELTAPADNPDSVKPSIRDGLIDLWFEVRPDRERNAETLAIASGWADDVITSKWEDEPATDSARPMGLSDIDWSGPADEIRNTLVEIWFQRHHWLERDSEALGEAEAWADDAFAENAQPPMPAARLGLVEDADAAAKWVKP